jgi:ferredoxin-NADP reductase
MIISLLPIGGEIKFAGPTGLFTLHENLNIPAVLIAGGIGITPFYSMIQHATEQQSAQTLFLFYGNQSRADAALLTELNQLQNKNPNLKLIFIMEKVDDSWQGEMGYITPTMLKKYIHDLHLPLYYICGSSRMVTALQEMLAEMGIDEDKIKIEDFPGY